MAKKTTVNQELLNRFIRHAVYLERFKAGEAKRIGDFLAKEVYPAVEAKVSAALAKGSSPTRLKQLQAAIDKTMQAGMVKAGKQTVESLKNLSAYEAKWVGDTIQDTVPLDIDMIMPSNEVLRQIVTTRPMEGHKLETWLSGHSMAARQKMMKQINVGIAMGESLPSIARRMRKVLTLKRKQAEYIARTAVSTVVHNARHEVYKQNQKLIKKYQWVATLDMRTTLICINLDGQVFPIGEGPQPPQHFNCRSTTIPVITAWSELGIEAPPPATRASMNGAVPETMTYKDWFKSQPVTIQRQVLGPKRYQLYKEGVPLRGFVGTDYKPLSLGSMILEEAASPELRAARARLAELRKQSGELSNKLRGLDRKSSEYKTLFAQRKLVKQEGDKVRAEIKRLKGEAVDKIVPKRPLIVEPDVAKMKYGGTVIDKIDTTANLESFVKDAVKKEGLSNWPYEKSNPLFRLENELKQKGFGKDSFLAVSRAPDGSIRGYMMVDATDKAYTISRVYAVQEGKGHGTEMLRAFYKKAIKEKRQVFVNVAGPQRRFFRKLGFRRVAGTEDTMKLTVSGARKQVKIAPPVLTTPTGTRFATAAEYREGLLAEYKAAQGERLTQYEKFAHEKQGILDKIAVAENEAQTLFDKYGFDSPSYQSASQRRSMWRERLREIEKKINKATKQVSMDVSKQRAFLAEKSNITKDLFVDRSKSAIKNRFYKKKWATVADDITNMIPSNRVKDFEMARLRNLTTGKRGNRQWGTLGEYYNYADRIQMYCSRSATFAHEFGHHISYKVDDIMYRQSKFFEKRTAGEDIVHFWGDVRGKKDKWPREYSGRVYPDGRYPEVISVGVESLWENPVAFARSDPEYFDMVVGALKGI